MVPVGMMMGWITPSYRVQKIVTGYRAGQVTIRSMVELVMITSMEVSETTRLLAVLTAPLEEIRIVIGVLVTWLNTMGQ